MSAKIRIGSLSGDGGTAKCHVRIDADGAAYVQDVTPPLPEGNYELSVGDLLFNVRHVKGEWVSANSD